MQRSTADASQAGQQPTAPSALLISALEVGALTGGGGLLLGSAQGILFSGSPAVFAAFAGVQWFTAGSMYWATRSAILNRRGLQVWLDLKRGSHPDASNVDLYSRKERVTASTIAGGISGGIVAAVTRSRSHIVPGAVMFALFGFVGQHMYNFVDQKQAARERAALAEKPVEGKNWLRKLADSRFSPVTVLSEDEYEHLLQEKLLKVEVEIALVDESIEKLRQQSNASESPDQQSFLQAG